MFKIFKQGVIKDLCVNVFMIVLIVLNAIACLSLAIHQGGVVLGFVTACIYVFQVVTMIVISGTDEKEKVELINRVFNNFPPSVILMTFSYLITIGYAFMVMLMLKKI